MFLDIDGVLNHHDAPSVYHERALLSQCIVNLNFALQISKCKVIIISNWAQHMSYEKLSAMLYSRGVMADTIIGAISMVPIDDSGLVMGIEKDSFVNNYVLTNKLKNYVIVDDNFPNASQFTGHLVSPNMQNGLNENDVVSILAILNINS